MNTLGNFDYAIFSFMLIVTLIIGLHNGLKKYYVIFINFVFTKSLKSKINTDSLENGSKINDYLIANGSMTVFPIALSLLATYYSSTALLGNPAEVYVYGIQHMIALYGMMTTTFIGALLTGPLFARLKVSSVFEYLKLRFDSEEVRLIAVFCYLIRNLISSAIYIYGPATSLNLLANISEISSIIIIATIGTFYTCIGGIRGVIWTDVFMLFIMFSGLIIIIVKGTLDIGSFSEMLNINRIGGRLDLFNFDPNPFVRQSFWSLYFGITVYFLMPYCIDQQMVQRFSSAKNVRTAQIALLLNAPGIFMLMNLCFVSGLVVYATYANCDPLTKPNGIIKSSNQILPYFVIDRLTSIQGAAGLFLSSIFAGALSSLSSILNSSAAILWQDFLKNLRYFQNSNDSQSILVTKICVIIIGILSAIISSLISTIGGNILTINFSLNGAFNAPIVGVFILASVFSVSNKHGATFGLVAGFIVGIWLSIGSYLTKPVYQKLEVSLSGCNLSHSSRSILIFNSSQKLTGEAINQMSGFNKIYSVSYLWTATIGILVTILVGLVVSLATKSKKVEKDTGKFMLFKSSQKSDDNLNFHSENTNL